MLDQKVELLNKLGVFTLKRFNYILSRTYQDRRKPQYLCDCVDGEETLVEVIATSKVNNIRIKGRTMQRLMISDETRKWNSYLV